MATFDIDEYIKLAMQGEAAAAATPAQPAASPGATPFYRRPITIPAGVKTAGRALLRGSGVLGAATLGADLLTDILPNMAANAIAGKPTVTATVDRGRAGYGAKPKPAAVAGTGPAAPAPMTADQQAAALEFGRLQAERDALVQAASPEAGGTGISLAGVGTRRTSPVAGFVGATLGLKRAVGDNARQTALNKLLFDAQTKLDVAKIGAAGRVAAADRSGGPVFTPTSGLPSATGEIDVLQTRGPGAGAVRRVKPQPVVTEAHLAADMQNKKLNREQVLAEYQRRGFDVSGIR